MRKILPIIFVLLVKFPLLAASQELNIAWETLARTFDPRYANDAFSQYLSNLTACSLINFDPSGNLIPMLAQSWKWVDDKSFIVSIKDKIVFNDGSPLQVEDVLATYDFLRKPSSSPLMGAFKKLKSVKKISKNEIKFELEEADSTFIDNLFIGILPKELANGPMVEDLSKLKSCGPYVLSNVSVGEYKLVKNDKYSLGIVPKISHLNIKIIKDETTRFSKLQKGEIDLVQNGINRDQLKSLSKHKNLTLQKREGLNVTYLGFNFKDPLLAKKEVRQAISMGINRGEMITYLLQGMAKPAAGFLTEGNPYRSNEIQVPKYDIKAANALLDKAGLIRKEGKKYRFELTFKTTSDVNRTNYAHAIAGALEKLGIKVHVQSLEWGKFKADVDKGEVQLWILNWIGYKDPDIYRYVFASESVPPNGGNRGWYQNKSLDEILKQGHEFHDVEKRKLIYRKVQKILEDDLAYAFLWHEENYAVMNKNIKGFEIYADGRYSSLPLVTK